MVKDRWWSAKKLVQRAKKLKHLIRQKPPLIYFFSFFQTGHTALQKASAEGHFEVVKQLISRGCLIDHQDDIVSISLYNFFNPKLLFFGILWYSLKLDNKSLCGSALYELKSFISLIIKKGEDS